MKAILLNGLLAALLLGLLSFMRWEPAAKHQPHFPTPKAMKINAGIVTPKLRESKEFYTSLLGYKVAFENNWYLLLHSPDGNSALSFLLPDQPNQNPLFRTAFGGKGVYLTVEVPDVDAEYRRIQSLNVPVQVPLREETWGDRHFAIVDPNGIGVDIVTYKPPVE
jgi:catechol 2,3-dioxygenase-like lactoylglutathione lyase family enzyme